jgi:2-dehydro-3-deoxyphosphogalactonate aldolase
MTLDEALAECPLVAIIRGVRPDEVLAIAEALWDGGVRVVEVPLNSPQPLESVARLSAKMSSRVVCGAGTVLDIEAVDAVAMAGGRIIVAPNTNADVIRRARAAQLDVMPGFLTPTEAFGAIEAGARILKLFPADALGPRHLKAIKAVLPPEIRVFPVGGVRPEGMADWVAAGAAGFGLGSELYKPGDSPEAVRAKAQTAVEALRRSMSG